MIGNEKSVICFIAGTLFAELTKITSQEGENYILDIPKYSKWKICNKQANHY